MPAMPNQSIRDIQSSLVKRFAQLQKLLDDATEINEAMAIFREMQEVNHRITLAGSLLFAQDTSALSDKAAGVAKASNQAAKAIRDAAEFRQALAAITDFLTLVDDAIDLAKTL
ncbi:MAG: hypothetical protein WC718_11575 [Phycisphaerales bacterium]|jgi:predicted HTH transcriptional regulator